MSLVIQCLDIDCQDPKTLAAFWREALGWRLTYASDDEYVLEPAEGHEFCVLRPLTPEELAE